MAARVERKKVAQGRRRTVANQATPFPVPEIRAERVAGSDWYQAMPAMTAARRVAMVAAR